MMTDLAGFVLRYFVLCVFFAVFAFAVCAAGFGNVDLEGKIYGLAVYLYQKKMIISC